METDGQNLGSHTSLETVAGLLGKGNSWKNAITTEQENRKLWLLMNMRKVTIKTGGNFSQSRYVPRENLSGIPRQTHYEQSREI